MPLRLIDHPNVPLQRLFEAASEVGRGFLERRMLCLGCLFAPIHTVLDACGGCDLEQREFRQRLREAVRRTIEDWPFRRDEGCSAGLSAGSRAGMEEWGPAGRALGP